MADGYDAKIHRKALVDSGATKDGAGRWSGPRGICFLCPHRLGALLRANYAAPKSACHHMAQSVEGCPDTDRPVDDALVWTTWLSRRRSAASH